MKSASSLARSGKRHASNICLVTFIIEIGFADPFDSQIFSMNAELSEEKMITRWDPTTTDRRARLRRKREGRGGEIERARV